MFLFRSRIHVDVCFCICSRLRLRSTFLLQQFLSPHQLFRFSYFCFSPNQHYLTPRIRCLFVASLTFAVVLSDPHVQLCVYVRDTESALMHYGFSS